MLINATGSTGAPSNAPYLTNGSVAALSAEVNVQALAADLAIKGDDAAGRTITLGQQVTNADTISVDVPFANFKVNASEVMAVGAAQTVTGAKTFNDQTIKLRNPGDTYSYTVVHSAITADRSLTVPLLTADDTLAVLAESQTLTNKTLGSGTTFSAAPTINSGVTFTFAPSTTVSGLNVGAISSDPSTLNDGDIWYNSTDNRMRYRQGGVTYDFGSGSGGAPVDAPYLTNGSNATLTNETDVTSLTANLAIKGDDAAGRTITLGQQVTNADSVTVDVPIANFTADGAAVVNLSAAQTLTNKTLSTNTAVTASISWGSGVRQTFNPNATSAGINVGQNAGDPTSGTNGDLYYDTGTAKLRAYEGGTWKDVIQAGAGGGNTLDAAYDQGGAGAGRTITADSGAVAITVPDASNNTALDLTQNDVTNNPAVLRVYNAGTGDDITKGSANQDLRLSANGTGLISLGSSVKVLNQGEVRLLEASANGTNYTAFKAAAAMAASVTYTLPDADGNANAVLATDGAGTLSWADISSSFNTDDFSGDGTTAVFTLSGTPSDPDAVIVAVDGVLQRSGATESYTISGTTLTFNSAPASGAKIQVKYPTGTIAASSHNLLSGTHADTTPASATRGAIIRGSATSTWESLAVGTADYALFSDGTDVAYRKAAGDVVLYVTYPGSVWTDNGSGTASTSATGTLKEDRDTTARRNYFHFDDTSVTLKDMTQVIEYRMPPWWRGWAATAMTFHFATETNAATDNKLDITVKDSAGTVLASKSGQVSPTGGSWTTATLASTDFSSLPAAEDKIVIELKCSSLGGNYVRLGEVEMHIGSST